MKTTTVASLPLDDSFAEGQDKDYVKEEASSTSLDWRGQHKELPDIIEKQLAVALLKLEYLIHVPGTAVDEF